MTERKFQADAEGYYVPTAPFDTTPLKVYAYLGKPGPFRPNGPVTDMWWRGSASSFAINYWSRIFDTAAEIEFMASKGVKFRYPELIERFLDEGHVLETLEFWFRRDEDDGHELGPRPENWTGPWEETLGYTPKRLAQKDEPA